MDFFETREKYRRQEARTYIRWFTRLFMLGLVFWLGWQWGSRDHRQIQVDAEKIIFERTQQIDALNRDIERLEHDLREAEAERVAASLIGNIEDSKLTRLVKGQLARGTSIEQIYQMLQRLGAPVNCRVTAQDSAAVATELYSGVESNLSFFDGGLGLHIDGQPTAEGSKSNPWFDPTRPVSARFIYLGAQKVVKGLLPLKAIFPAEDWLLEIEVSRGELRGYVDIVIKNCAIR